jgi:hypothetical protein
LPETRVIASAMSRSRLVPGKTMTDARMAYFTRS